MTKVPKAVVVLAPGFEEIEAVSIIDVLRRAEVEVTIAGLHGAGPVVGAHDVEILADAALAETRAAHLDLLVLPGGMSGTTNLAASEMVLKLVREMVAADKLVGAICAAPIALHAAGVLGGRRVTSYPSLASSLSGVHYAEDAVVRDGCVITSRGVGTALAFALELVRALGFEERAADLGREMLVGSEC